ncbi:von Willebrand factor type A domain protein [Planctomycetes bacterium Poly30]|uniref:von Willebrand factor type A domain protein n=1 Tax=Saltatorellus ferox TaxID=2528018 RepID=A0A518EPS7_9BACT|nr:von Willebrand factor type A domain protein [Planctomycetes bacterium Poly30]
MRAKSSLVGMAFGVFAAAGVALSSAFPVIGGDLPSIVLTADVGGQVEACGGCSAASRRGGAASWKAAALSAGADTDAVWLDAGGFLFGAAEPARVAEAFAALEYSAINLAASDFRLGLAFTLEVVAQAGLPTVSANLLGADGQPLFTPFRVIDAGGSPLAIVGLTEAPAALAYLPTLKDQLAGITFEDPLSALDRVLPEAEAAADHVVVLVHGSRRTLDAVRARHGSRVTAICAGGLTPDEAEGREENQTAPTLATRPGGSHLSVLPAGTSTPNLVLIPLSATPDPRVEAALASAEDLEVIVDAEAATAPRKGDLILTVHGTEHAGNFGRIQAREGRGLLVIDLEIENNIPMELAFGGEREAGERLKVALTQNLLLLHEAAGSSAMTAIESVDLQKTEGALPRSFVLQNIGSSARGKVAFELPLPLPDSRSFERPEGGSLSLWLENDELEPSSTPIFGTRREAAPLEIAQANDYLGFAQPTVQFHPQLDGRTAPEGMRWAEVALTGVSTRLFEGARPKAAVYLAAPIHMQLVTDGIWAHLREGGLGTLPDVPGFLPGLATGGTAVFLIPETCEHVALELVFPILQNAGGAGAHLKPKTLVFDLEGTAAEPSPEKALTVVDDEPVDMAVIGFAVQAGDAGRSIVELDLRLINRGEDDGQLDLTNRFRADDVSFVGAFGAAGETLDPRPLLPAGEKRALRVRLDVPDSMLAADAFEVSYSGIAVNPTLRLAIGGAPNSDVSTEAVTFEEAPGKDEESAAGPSDVSSAFRDDLAIRRHTDPGEVPDLADARGSGSNDAIELVVEGASLVDSIGSAKERDGLQYLVLETRWRLLAPEPNDPEDPAAILEAYELERRESLHLVYNGRRLLAELGAGPAALPRSVRVPSSRDEQAWQKAARAGAGANAEADAGAAGPRPREITGQLVYSVPKDGLRNASLHLLDPRNGNITLDLFGAAAPEAPALGSASNGCIEAGVFGVEVLPERGRSEDCVVAVDLRAASLLSADPRTFDDRTEPVAHLLQPLRDGSVHLLFDGEFPVNCTGEELESPLWCLPESMVRGMTGGAILFTVPKRVLEDARTIELVVGMDEVAVPREMIRRPAPLTITLREPVASLTGPGSLESPRWSVEDGGLFVSFHDVRTAPSDPPWVEMVVRLENRRNVFVLWEPGAALELLGQPDGAEGEFSATAPERNRPRGLRLPFPSQNTLWIPAGSTRIFEVRFRAKTPALALRYSGLLRSVDLAFDAAAEPMTLPMPLVDGHAVVDRTRTVKGIAALGLRGQDVNRAIDRGRDWMLDKLSSRPRDRGVDGYQEVDLVMMLALVHARAHIEFPDFDEQLQSYLDDLRPGFLRSQSTYRNGILAMLLDAYGDPRYLPLLRDAAAYLVNAQGPSGTWSYRVPLPEWLFELAPAPEDAEGPTLPTSPLRVIGAATHEPAPISAVTDRAPDRTPLRREVDWERGADGDNSLTQYAILGLHAAERQGIAIDPDVWRRTLGTTWTRQSATNGWSYVSGSPYGTMTCAGATITAIAMRSLEPRRDPLLDPRLRKGLGWLARHWAIDKNPDEQEGKDDHLYYHYYGLERTGRLLDTEFYGAHEWYATVAKRLVDGQSASGAWPAKGSEREELTTAFAILFLTRATETLDPELLATERAAREAALPKLGHLEMRSLQTKDHSVLLVLDASGSMLAPPGSARAGDRTPKFEHARAALRDVVESLPEGAPVGLVVYGHRKRARDEGADTDVETLIPVGPLKQDAFLEALDSLKPRGKTPLALALDEALKGLGSSSRKDSTIVLLTDGGQGREPGDPVKSAERVGRAKVKLEIVAFDLGDGANLSTTQAAWNEQIRAMADASEGRAVSVVDADRLAAAVSAAATGKPGLFELTNEAGALVQQGPFGGKLELEPGSYVFRTTFAGAPFEVTLEIERGRTTRVEFDAAKVPR